MKRIKFTGIGLFLFITNALGLPNLSTTIPAGWDAPLVVSLTQDLISEDTLYTNSTYYYNWAITNNGDQAVSNAFNIQIVHGDSVIKSYRPSSLNVGTVLKVTYLQHKTSNAGNCMMRLVVDSLNEVSESNENDNQYSHTFYWKTGAPPDIDITPGLLYYSYHVPGTKYSKCSWIPGEVIVDIDIPIFDIREISKGTHRVDIEGFNNLNDPGKPALPFKFLTLAIPPDAKVQSVEVKGNYSTLTGTYNVEPASAMISLSTDFHRISMCNEQYNKNKELTYSSNNPYPVSNGELISTGGLRKYNLVNVIVYPVKYVPLKGELLYATHLQVVINYSKDTEKEIEHARLASDNFADLEAYQLVYNFSQAKEWYPYTPGEKGKATYDYVIITTSALVQACSTIANWKTGLGYKVNIVTKEWINGTYTGVDIQQKIRNFLRDKYPSGQWGIKYVLIVGEHADIPMRMCYTQSNNSLPSWAEDAYDYPILTDLYYADLTSADNLSWNKDGDSYWGEALTYSGSSGGDDSPDYIPEVFLGRVPWSDANKIKHIGNKITNFERNTDLSYKKKALCAQAILQFSSTFDAATTTENMISANILTSSSTTKLYEKKGRVVSSYSCTDSLTKANTKSRWQGVGIFTLCAHGWTNKCSRLIWVTDNGDGVAQENELASPELLSTSDASDLDDNYPANAFLMSCILGHPETTNNLGASLLNQGCVSVIAASRSVYTSLSNNMQYYFFNKLLKDTSTSHARVGAAFDLGRQNYASGGSSAQNTWINLFAFNLYGDPSLSHFGYDSTSCSTGNMWICNRGGMPTSLSVSNITYSAPWIAEVTPTSMTLNPGESSGVSVTVQPAGLEEGYYYDTLLITSNDPDETIYREPVTLRIIVGGIAEIIPSTSSYLKMEAFPNPFGKEITIKCSVPLNKVSLGIYDVSGRLVKSFSNIKTSTTNVIWDASTYPAGIYFVRLKAGDLKTSGKIILIK